METLKDTKVCRSHFRLFEKYFIKDEEICEVPCKVW